VGGSLASRLLATSTVATQTALPQETSQSIAAVVGAPTRAEPEQMDHTEQDRV